MHSNAGPKPLPANAALQLQLARACSRPACPRCAGTGKLASTTTRKADGERCPDCAPKKDVLNATARRDFVGSCGHAIKKGERLKMFRERALTSWEARHAGTIYPMRRVCAACCGVKPRIHVRAVCVEVQS